MITTDELKNILLRRVKESSLNPIPEIKKDKHRPVTKETVAERVVVTINGTSNTPWQISYGHVCVYVPDVSTIEEGVTYNESNSARLGELEKVCVDMFHGTNLLRKGEDIIYYEMVEPLRIEEDPETWSHFINVRLKFTNTNFKK